MKAQFWSGVLVSVFADSFGCVIKKGLILIWLFFVANPQIYFLILAIAMIASISFYAGRKISGCEGRSADLEQVDVVFFNLDKKCDVEGKGDGIIEKDVS